MPKFEVHTVSGSASPESDPSAPAGPHRPSGFYYRDARAEEILSALAAELRSVPVCEETRELHLCALNLIRLFRRYRERPLSAKASEDFVRRLEHLRHEASACKSSLSSGQEMFRLRRIVVNRH